MSGYLAHNNFVDAHLQSMNKIAKDSIEELINNWTSIYGQLDEYLQDKLKAALDDVRKFWDNQVEDAVKEKKTLMAKVESLGHEAFILEKALNLPSKSTSNNMYDIPLLKLEDELKKLVNSYSEIKNERLREYMELKNQESELCDILNETPHLSNFSSSPNQTISSKVHIPSGEDMEAAVVRIDTLKDLKNKLQLQFEKLKCELKTILEECEIIPFNKIECAAFGNDEKFPCTKKNLEALLESTDIYRLTRDDKAAKAEELRNQISSLWNKMLKDKIELQDLLLEHKDFKKSTIQKLENILKSLQVERKEKMKELIFASRIALDDLWTKCCYSDDQRTQFKPYYANHYTEDVLELHELEVERLQHFYDEHKHIYQLTSRHEELWKRLLHLEEQAKRSDRLFKNRGGQLLLEEKERKLVQKKLPAIKAELTTLLEQYKMTLGRDFLYFGEPLLEQLEQQEEERKTLKENEKLQRKAANVETLQLESRHGARPVATIAGGKRKLLTPQSTNINKEEAAVLRKRMQSPYDGYKVPIPRTPGRRRTPAATTPAPKTPVAIDLNNGSPTYESFQEHMNTVSNENCLSSTKLLGKTVLRPRNQRSRFESPKSTPYKTPSKTPTRIPFRIATGSKIPTVVPPISPRSASRLTASRVKLPIIF